MAQNAAKKKLFLVKKEENLNAIVDQNLILKGSFIRKIILFLQKINK